MAYKLGETDNGKVIEAYMQETRGLYRIRFNSGGELPKELEGEFTNVGEAQKEVNVYLSNKEAEKQRAEKAKRVRQNSASPKAKTKAA